MAIRTGSTDDFRAKYRNIDVLLLDDVHFIAGKEQTQEEFFHTFNALHSSNRQIVLTSDRAPQAIPTLEDRLRSRFAWGMIADIQPPNLETRVAILQSKAASMGRRVSDDVLLAIAQRAHRNIRDLEGALTKVVAHAETFNRPISVAVVEEALAYLAPAQGKLTLETILNSAADFFGVPGCRADWAQPKRKDRAAAPDRDVRDARRTGGISAANRPGPRTAITRLSCMASIGL